MHPRPVTGISTGRSAHRGKDDEVVRVPLYPEAVAGIVQSELKSVTVLSQTDGPPVQQVSGRGPSRSGNSRATSEVTNEMECGTLDENITHGFYLLSTI